MRAKAQDNTWAYWKAEKDVKNALKLYTERESNGLNVNDNVKMTLVPRSTIYEKINRL